MLHLNNKKFNYVLSDYLMNYDLLNKYSLLNLYQRPKIKKIVVYFLLKDLLAASNLSKKNNNIQIKAFFIFYILFALTSFLNISDAVVNKNLQKTAENPYALKIVLSSKEDINTFLLMFFIENYNSLIKEQISIFKDENGKAIDNSQKNLVYQFSIPGKIFFDLNDFFTQNTKDTNLKDLNIKFSFVFEGLIRTKNTNSLIKNLSFFWLAP
jgi:hypothetical protein